MPRSYPVALPRVVVVHSCFAPFRVTRMGVDIILFGERRTPNGTWEVIGDLVPNVSYDADDPDFVNEPPLIPDDLDIPRCSALFAILADVNNNRTAEPYEPISLPRGLPLDASPLTLQWYSCWAGGAFGASWLTIGEIDSYDWMREKQHYGSVDPRAEFLFRSNPFGFPFADWPQGVQVSYSEHTSDVGNARWRSTYAESAGLQWFRELLKPFELFDDVRLVFWFDH